MFFSDKRYKGKKFSNKKYLTSKVNSKPEYNLDEIYERCIDEMVAQQTKRDQIITIYLAMFSFIVSYVMFSEKLNFELKGYVLLSVAIIGVLFSMIIIRYRMYKESYWICCQTITNLMNFNKGEIDKVTIQSVYYQCIKKKADKYVKRYKDKEKTIKLDKPRFKYWNFFYNNVFSGETIYCLIHMFIVSILCGLSIYFIGIKKIDALLNISLLVGIVTFVLQIHSYFKNLINTYGVLVYGTEKAFNFAFSKAWFLHLYLDEQKEEE